MYGKVSQRGTGEISALAMLGKLPLGFQRGGVVFGNGDNAAAGLFNICTFFRPQRREEVVNAVAAQCGDFFLPACPAHVFVEQGQNRR